MEANFFEEEIWFVIDGVLNDKLGVIDDICRYVSLDSKNDISTLLDKQYQKKGNRGTNLFEFFGRDNYEKIAHICGDRAKQFGYPV